jgi:hypothetical protein
VRPHTRSRPCAFRRPGAGYIGKSDAFDDALASFAMAHAARTQQDYYLLAKAKQSAAKGG